MKRVCGIVGGMGPMATADLFMKIINGTKAQSDQNHMRVLIDSNTRIPDRTAAILHGGASPVPELVRSAKTLEAAGADFLVMPCNTAHYFYDAVRASVSVPLLNMLEETATYAASQGVKTAALLATNGTRRAKLYGAPFQRAGVRLLEPSEKGQEAVMAVIYDGVKAGRAAFDVSALGKELDSLQEQGAERFLLACTELPLAFDRYGLNYPAIDPTSILARAAVLFGGYEWAE